MAVTRIKNNQINDSTITGAKMVSNTITSGLLEDDLTYGSNFTVSGNLTVNGTTTTVDTTNTLIADPLFVLSRGETGTPSADSGLVIERGTSTNVAFIWDESADTFTVVNTTEDGSTAGDITIASYADFKAGAMTLESIIIDNITIDGNSITSTDTNGAINLTPNGTGEVVMATAVVSDLTSGRVMLAGTSGAIEDSANLTFDGSTLTTTGAITATTTVTGATITDGTASLASGSLTGAVNVTASGTITGGTITDGTASLASGTITGGVAATFSGAITGGSLTDGTATLASGSLTGAVNVTASGTVTGGTLTDGTASLTSGALSGATTGAFSSNVTVGGTLGVTGESTLASATISDLTDGRVVLAGTAGAIEDSANFTFDGTTLTTTAAAIDNVGIDANSITGTGNLILEASASSAIIVNEAGADVDFRVEGSGEANALFVEGSTGNIGVKTATPTAGASLHINSTDSMIIPSGTTAQRPASPAGGMTRFNTTLDKMEFYSGNEWLIAGADFTIITADSFDGDGSVVAFTLSESTTTAGCIVSINGVVQDPGSSYSVSGTTLTFTEAPETGDNIDVRILTTTATIEGADSADKWTAARTITLAGDVTGSVSIDGSADVTLTTVVVNDSHEHIIGDVDGLQAALDLKAPLASPALTGTPTAPTAAANTNTTQVATTAYVQTEITDLIGGAPGALDTLNELAAAIDDDASYASTVTTALGNRLSSTATVTLSGDVTGTANFSSNVATISATIAADSVALGTDTTGNYVQQGATSGNGISGSVNSEGGTFTVASNAVSENTASTIVFRDSSGNFSAGTITATATSAQYADLAENYTADANYEAGTVVSFGGDAEVTANGADMDRRVAGVVSTDPAHLMNADCAGDHVVALALQGRVPCKVTGAVAKGDIMVAAGNGMARAEADPKVGTVIGKALEAHASGEGVIEVAVGRF